MIDEDKLSQAAAKAVRAKQLLENELLAEAFAMLEEQYTKDLIATTVNQVDARENLYRAIRVLREVNSNLHHFVTNGKLAQAELKQLADTAERKKRFGIL